jgi:hypothetical protein
MRPLDRKLLRDLWRLRGQVLAIGMVIASGVGVLVMSLTAIEALQETADAYYERYRFAQVFARVERAPQYLADRLALIEGVQSVETRVVRNAVLDVEGFEEPVIGQLVSVPEDGEPRLNRLAIRQGRYPRLGAPDEVVLSEPFAEAHALGIGDQLRAIINGRWRELHVVGIALSPEYVYTIGPGALMPDDRRFGVLWLGHEALQSAFNLDGAFNDVSLGLLRGADPEYVVDRVDSLLARYGSIGAYARADQLSNWFLMNEITQLKTLARILPTVFLAVAAFLTNMVLARLVAVERSEIGLLKAFGYSNAAIAWHYVKLVLVISAVGIGIGWFAGYWLGLYNTTMYAEFYRFPFLLYRPGPVHRRRREPRRGAARHDQRRARRGGTPAGRGDAPAVAAALPAQPALAPGPEPGARPADTHRAAAGGALSVALVRDQRRYRSRRRGPHQLDAMARRDRPHRGRLLPAGAGAGRHRRFRAGPLRRCSARSRAPSGRDDHGADEGGSREAPRRTASRARGRTGRPCTPATAPRVRRGGPVGRPAAGRARDLHDAGRVARRRPGGHDHDRGAGGSPAGAGGAGCGHLRDVHRQPRLHGDRGTQPPDA